MNNEQKSMLIEMAKNQTIPNAIKVLKEEIDKLSINISNEDAKAIFEKIEDNHEKLVQKIGQLKSFFK